MTTGKIVKTRYGHVMQVNPADEIGREIIRKGIYDRSHVELLIELLKRMRQPGVFDIGANIGNHAIAISGHCRMVHAFEPDAGIFALLQRNIELNRIDNIHAHEICLSNTRGTSDLYLNLDGNLGASTLNPGARANNYRKMQVQLTTGDSFIEEKSINRLDLIKIDIEGHEIPALEGLRESIQRFMPVIMMEWSAENTISQSGASAFFSELVANYSFFHTLSSRSRQLWPDSLSGKIRRLAHKAGRERWVLVPANLAETHANVLLVPRDRLELTDGL